MANHYTESHELYKIHSESFIDDYDYYLNLCHGYKTLEVFSGYGRLTNFLVSNNVSIESVELEKRFADFINLPPHSNHVIDVLEFSPNKQYERIIAGYNSFCLFLEDDQIAKFFNKMNGLLVKGGILSLSYYPVSAWKDSDAVEIEFNGEALLYKPRFDFSLLEYNIATWIDEYSNSEQNFTFKYPTRVYRNHNEVLHFIRSTNLRLINIIENYNKNLSDNGWIEYVFTRD